MVSIDNLNYFSCNKYHAKVVVDETHFLRGEGGGGVLVLLVLMQTI